MNTIGLVICLLGISIHVFFKIRDQMQSANGMCRTLASFQEFNSQIKRMPFVYYRGHKESQRLERHLDSTEGKPSWDEPLRRRYLEQQSPFATGRRRRHRRRPSSVQLSANSFSERFKSRLMLNVIPGLRIAALNIYESFINFLNFIRYFPTTNFISLKFKKQLCRADARDCLHLGFV